MTGSGENAKRELLRRLLQERAAKQQDSKTQGLPVPLASANDDDLSLKPTSRDRELELSFGQEMVWLLEQILPEAMFYNVVERFGIRGALDVDLLRFCIDEIIRRHEALRTVYPMVAGRPVQKINPPAPCNLEIFDLRQIPLATRDQEVRRIIIADVKTRFDIAVGPVLRPSLFRVGDYDYILAVVVHHIAIDGWSLRLFMHEIAGFYRAFSKGETPDLPAIPVQYADFAYWERRWLTDERLAGLRDYWRKTLGDRPPSLNLGTDYPPPPIRTFDSTTHQVTVPGNVVEGLREIGRRAGATFFTVLLAGFMTLLMRYTSQEDFVVGSVITSRPRPEVESLLGFFINSLALRLDLSGNPTFSDLVARSREVVFAAHAHGAYPFQRLVEDMQPKRSVNSNPFARIFLNMLNLWDRDEVSIPNLSIRPLGGLDLHMPVDFFTLFAAASDRHLNLMFVYSTELFKATTMERMAADLQLLLEAAALAPRSRIWDLPMSTPPAEALTESLGAILFELDAAGVRLSVDEGKLRVSAPKGALNDRLKNAIASNRDEIIVRLLAEPKRESDDRKLRRVSRTPPLPLTAVQKRFWFLDKIGQGRSVPNVMFPLRFEGHINFDAMFAAVKAILGRHEVLRMRIGDRDGEPYPEITALTEDLVILADLTTLPEADSEHEADRLSKAFVQDEFNLVTGPLARGLLVRLSPTVNLVTLSMHHIVGDGWSSSILLRELGVVYSALSKGAAPDLPPLAYQYVDYAAWEAGQVRAGLFERQLSYWREKLAGVPPLLDLPTDRPRPAQRSFNGARVDCVIEADVVERLQQFSKRHDATLFMTVLAAFAVVLHRLTAQDDIVIGTPVANRGSPELEQIVGPFVNSLSLRLNVAGNPSFSSYLSQVRRTAIEAIDNRDVPFDMVVEAINPERTLDHAPIYQVMFGLHNFPVQPPQFEDLECSFVSPDTRVARMDLQLDMAVHEGRLFGAYEYASDLFDHATIERLHEQLVEALKGILTDEGQSVRDLPIRSKAQDRILLDVWNDTRVDHDRDLCLHELFERATARSPEAAAFVIGAQTYSYREIDRRANQLARLLRARGVRPGDRVGVCLDRTVETPIALAAVLKAGAAYVPLDPAHPPDRLRYIIEDAGTACLVTLSWFAEMFGAADIPKVLLDEQTPELEGLDASALAIPVAPDDLAYVIYTSGSTGRPKGVQVEHRNVVSFLAAMRREPGLEASDVLLAVTTFSFDIAGLEIWLPLSVGAKVVLAGKADVLIGRRLIDLIDQHRVTTMQATPSTWRLVVEAGWTGNAGMKALCGGEAMPIDLAAILLSKVGQLWNMYGPTETTIWSTTSRVTATTGAPPIGRPIANTRVFVLEPSGALAAIGGFGELAIGGEGVARGYWRRPELTAEKFVSITLPDGRTERVFLTGDIVRFRNDGQLEYRGRRDTQIKLRGYRIELGEIEAYLSKCQGVKEAAVILRADEPGDQRLVAYVVAPQPGAFEPEAARTVLKAALPGYMLPADFVIMDAMPLTPNGKVSRAALPAPRRESRPSPQMDGVVIMTPTQRRVADIWSEVLRADRISLHDNFFDVGGHSMLVVKLHAALKREFDSDVTLTELFQQTTVAAQAARMSLSNDGDGDAALRRAEARARKRLYG